MTPDTLHHSNPQDPLRARLALAESQHRQARAVEPLTLWRLVSMIHAHPGLRAWVTLESRPLVPLVVPSSDESGGFIHVLLAAPGENPRELQAPWGWVTFHWPDGKLYLTRSELELF